MELDSDTCHRALAARDPRFDGVFFVGVTTTGVYCRPICPARTPRRDRTQFFRSAALAEKAGFRACFRCRPEIAPGLAPIDARARLAKDAALRIAVGAGGSLEGVAGALGVSSRHLRRVLGAELGVSPVELAQTHRLALAKQLLQDTSLSIAEIAFASGFSSVRRFNGLFSSRFARPPSALRAEARRARAEAKGDAGPVTLRLDARDPFDWDGLVAFLAFRAIPGVEHVTEDHYARAARVGDAAGSIVVRRAPSRPGVLLELSLSLVPAISEIVRRVRGLFDLDARPSEIEACLSREPALSRLVRARPGLRVPGAFDGFEMAVRAILGQQVSVRAATTIAGRAVAAWGAPIDDAPFGLTSSFPPAAAWARAGVGGVAALGVPTKRAEALVALARAVNEGKLRLDRGADPLVTMSALEALPGCGEWTAHYVAMRALGWPDAFPATDLVVRRRLGEGSAARALAAVERARPYRAYAALHAWMKENDDANDD